MSEIPTVLALKSLIPQSEGQRHDIKKYRQVVRNILTGVDPRMLLVLGPCSVHDVDAALEYAHKLQALSRQLNDQFFIVMRVYCQKPRTRLGWKGLMADPHLDGSCDTSAGVYRTRKLMADLTDLGIPIATEFLYPHFTSYIEEWVTWGAIGARTSESPIHREMASGLAMPVGFKNTRQGDFSAAINGMSAAAASHHVHEVDLKGSLVERKTAGNPDTHLILRGSDQGQNYQVGTLNQSLMLLSHYDLHQRVMVDCSHGNARQDHSQQIEVARACMKSPHPALMGLMFESFLMPGKQAMSQDLRYGQSITDPCLSWPQTAELLTSLARQVAKRALSGAIV